MSKKLSVRILVIIFVVLFAFVIVSELVDMDSGERTFKSDIVQIDSTKITEVIIYPKAHPDTAITLKKTGANWQLFYNNKRYKPNENMIGNMINELLKIKAQRVAATDKEKWGKYEVADSSATRVKVKHGKELAADFYIGKFTFKQQRNPMMQQNPYMRQQQQPQITSYVRIADDNNVYAVDGMLSMAFNREINAFRDNQIINSNKNDWTKLTYNYPADSSFVLSNNNGAWMLGGTVTDSAKTAEYLNSIDYLTNSTFVDDAQVDTPLYSVTIEGKNFSPINIKAFPADSIHKFYIHSSENDGVYFSCKSNNIADRLFVSPSDFFASDTTDVEKAEK